MENINGIDVDKIKQIQERLKQNPSTADQEPKVLARWLGGKAARIECGSITSLIGGEGNLNAMQTLLGALAACDVDVIAMHAALVGMPIEELWIEASGHFNTEAYYGVNDALGSGYDRIAYTVHLKAPDATSEQINYLKERCERSSPVGNSLNRSIPLTIVIVQ
jgi:uncharacterized OsmC-like protein